MRDETSKPSPILFASLAALVGVSCGVGFYAASFPQHDAVNDHSLQDVSVKGGQAVAKNIDQQELGAQQEIANWTKNAGLIDLAGVALGLVSILLLWRTWTEAQRAANAGARANEIARDNLIAAHRAWLKTTVFPLGKITISEGAAILPVRVSAKNIGRGLARNVRLHAYITTYEPDDYGDDAVLKRLNYGTHGTQFSRHLFPDEELGLDHQATILSPARFLEKQTALGREGTDKRVPLFLIAFADYQLPFDGPDDERRISEIIKEIHGPDGRLGIVLEEGKVVASLTSTALGSGQVT